MFKSARFSAFNIALWHAVASVVLLAVFAAPLWYGWHASIAMGRRDQLRGDAERFVAIATAGAASKAGGVREAIDEVVLDQVNYASPRQIFLLTSPDFTPIRGNLPRWPAALGTAPGLMQGKLSWHGHVVDATLWHAVLPSGDHLLVGLDIDRFRRVENLFIAGLGACAVAVLLVALGGGLVIRRTLLGRIAAITRTSAAIVGGDLSHRLPRHDDAEELALLTATINGLLDQIEHHVLAAKNTSSAIAHDLRTPLAELRARLETVAITRPAPEDVFAEVDGAIADTDRVIAIFNAMLRLAEIDSGSRRAGFVIVTLDAVVREVAEFYQPVAEMKGIGFSCDIAAGLCLQGDPVLLAQAVGNLIENALKYTPAGGRILVSLREGAGGFVLAVADNGPGIADAEKGRVLERFYRCDRSRNTEGLGLGLSLVAAVTRLHEGELLLGDENPGLRVSLCFPLSPGC